MSWYAEGLRFSCTQCGNCCTGDSGSVRIGPEEARKIAQGLDLAEHEFLAMHTESRDDGARTLRELRNGDCTFFDRERGCRVYDVRPKQCRTWPFWRGVIASRERWQEEAKHCPGMNQGMLVDADRIVAIARDDGTSGRVPRAPEAGNA